MALYMHVDDSLRRGSSRFMRDPMDDYNDDEFYCRYRLNKDTVRWLKEELFPIAQHTTERSIEGRLFWP